MYNYEKYENSIDDIDIDIDKITILSFNREN